MPGYNPLILLELKNESDNSIGHFALLAGHIGLKTEKDAFLFSVLIEPIL